MLGVCRGLRRSRPMLLLAVVVAAIAVVFSAAPAIAGLVTQPGPKPLARATGLTATERRAITLTSVSAAGDDSLGLILTARFAGGVDTQLGQGRLEHGLLALTLLRSGSARPAGQLVSEGGGSTTTRLTFLERRGRHRVLRHETFELFTPDRNVRTAAAQGVQVIRDRQEFVFYVPAGKLAAVNKISLEVFVERAKPVELATLSVDTTKLTCPQLAKLHASLAALRSQLNAAARAQKDADAVLSAAIDKAQLTTPLHETAERIAHLDAEIATVSRLLDRAGARINACNSPPPPKTPQPTATTASAPTPSPRPPPPPPPPVQVTQTDPALSQQMAPEPTITSSSTPPTGVPIIDVNNQVQYQKFSGIGAAMTDSSASLIYNDLSQDDRLTLMQNLFGSSGIHLNFLRVPMGASDFTVSADPYTYDDVPSGQTDPNLSQFSINHDLAYIIPTLQLVKSVNPGLEILANPWSPPAWMKANDSLDNTNDSGTLLTSAYGPLANYFVKVIQAYESNGVPIDAITPQNEPRTSGSGTSYPGLTLPEPNEASFISADLAPALAAAHLSTKIYGNDLSWDQLTYASGLTTSSAANDLSGIAWHCYFGSPTVMSQLHQSDPGLDQIEDECSPELRSFGTPELLISTLRNWASVVALWNVALDPSGGPKETNNGCPTCTGVVTINESTQTVTYSNEYYQLGQVSAFVSPGATRVDSQSFVTYGTNGSNILTVTSGLDDVAFVNPDGSHVLIAYNNSTAPISFGVQSNGDYFTYTIPSQAMTTFVWQ
jgi:glucosylceramidase